MPTEPDGLDASRVARERHLIEGAQRDICAAFPWLPAERVSVMVECLWAQYDDARIRDFIPVLVRKQAREELRDQFHTEELADAEAVGGRSVTITPSRASSWRPGGLSTS